MSLSMSSLQYFDNSISNDFALENYPPTGSLKEKKVKKVKNKKSAFKENIGSNNNSCSTQGQISKVLPSSSYANHDKQMIETALNIEQTQLHQFQNRSEVPQQALVSAVAMEIANARRLGKLTEFGGFGKENLDRWKFVVKFNSLGKIENLFIG